MNDDMQRRLRGRGSRERTDLTELCMHGQEFRLYPKSTMESLKKFKHVTVFNFNKSVILG